VRGRVAAPDRWFMEVRVPPRGLGLPYPGGKADGDDSANRGATDQIEAFRRGSVRRFLECGQNPGGEQAAHSAAAQAQA